MANYKLSTACKIGDHPDCAVRWKGVTRAGRETTYRCPCNCHPSISVGRSQEAVASA